MSGAPAAARLDDPVAHSHALAGFLAGAVVGFVAAAEAAAVIGAVVGAVALEVTTAGLATPLVVGVAATALELGVGGYVGAKLMGGAEDTGEALGSQSLGAASGKVAQGSPNVRTNGRPAAHALDAETCHAGQVAQGSKLVRINGLPASRVGDKTTCGAQISAGSANVRIGGPPDTRAGIQSEVPEWVRWATLVVTILPALGEAGRLAGPILREVEASGLPRAMMTGVKALGRALEERGGGGAKAPVAGEAPAAGAAKPPAAFPYSPKKIGQTEPGAVPPTPELQAQIQAAETARARSAPGYPDLPADKAATFGDDVRPWNGDEHTGSIKRVIGSDDSANGGFWQSEVPSTEGKWRGGSAVLNNWNGNGGYVESSSEGLRGWIGSARPQISSDDVNILPGGGEQIWIPPGSAKPGAPQPTPWSGR